MILAIDTSTSQLGLALYDGVHLVAELTWASQLRHTEELALTVGDLLARCGKSVADLGALGIALGPGSFTSLRVGVAFAKGLAMARVIPILGIPTLDINAAAIAPTDGKKLVAVLQAGRGRLAVGWYRCEEDQWVAEGPAKGQTAPELAETIHHPVIVCGELNADERQILARKYRNVCLASPVQCVRRPGLLAEMAWKRWQAGDVDAPAALAPIYLHVAGGLPG